jgi:hypothetical protein
MSQSVALLWLELALQNFKERYAPNGWSISILVTDTHNRSLRFYGLWKDIHQSWVELGGQSLQDPLSFDEDNPLGDSDLAGDKTEAYTIQKGRTFLTQKFHPVRDSKWLEMVPELAGSWSTLWADFKGVRNVLPPTQTLFWWRFLHCNLMTGARLHHMNPAASDMCHLCNSG